MRNNKEIIQQLEFSNAQNHAAHQTANHQKANNNSLLNRVDFDTSNFD